MLHQAVQSTLGATLFECVPGAHTNDLNRRPFVIRHSLAGHPLFELDRLATLAEFLRASGRTGSVLYRQAAVEPHTMGAWDNLGDTSSIADSIRKCGVSHAWMALHDSEADPEYRELLHAIVGDLSKLVGRDLLAEGRYVTGHIFIGCPNSVTDYHMDSETNFLVVVSGTKHFEIFDGDDASIVPQTLAEEFYWGNANGMRYDPEQCGPGTPIELGPGDCLHVPVNFPHWVQNGPEPCIALSVLIYLPENVDRAQAFQTNWVLRRLGLSPKAIRRDDAVGTRRRGTLFRMLSRRKPLDKRDVILSGRQRFRLPARIANRALTLAKTAVRGK